MEKCKKKKLLILFNIFIISILLTSCSDSTTSSNGSTGPRASEQYELPAGMPDITCKVKSILGNEITVYIAKQQEKNNQTKPQENSTETENNRTQSPLVGSSPARPAEGRPQGAGNAAGQRRMMEFNQETETIIIPVGTPIVTIKVSNGERTFETSDLSVITKDSILRIWKNEDTKEIQFVQIMNMGNIQ